MKQNQYVVAFKCINQWGKEIYICRSVFANDKDHARDLAVDWLEMEWKSSNITSAHIIKSRIELISKFIDEN